VRQTRVGILTEKEFPHKFPNFVFALISRTEVNFKISLKTMISKTRQTLSCIAEQKRKIQQP
jgi:hypothetical protein